MNLITTCTFLLLDVVLGKANPGYIKCPKPEELCLYGSNLSFSITGTGAPECWIRNDPNMKGRTTCYNKPFKGSCKPDDNSIDISQCPGYKPKSDPICPTESDVCRLKGQFNIPFTDEKKPRCWAKVEGKWYCDFIPKNGNCYEASDGSGGIDVATCKQYQPKNYCPKGPTMCLMGGDMAFDFNSNSPPQCWIPNKSGHPACYYKSKKDGCGNDKGVQDVSKCPGFNQLETDCPKKDSTCLIGDIAYLPSQPFSPPCWKKKGEKFVCKGKPKNGTCYEFDGYFDVTECIID